MYTCRKGASVKIKYKLFDKVSSFMSWAQESIRTIKESNPEVDNKRVLRMLASQCIARNLNKMENANVPPGIWKVMAGVKWHVEAYCDPKRGFWKIGIQQTKDYSTAVVNQITPKIAPVIESVEKLYIPKPENPLHEPLKAPQQQIEWWIYTNKIAPLPSELENSFRDSESAKKAVNEALKQTQQKAAEVEVAHAQLTEIKQKQQKEALVHVRNVTKTNEEMEKTINSVSPKRKSQVEEISKISDNIERKKQLNQIQADIIIGDPKNRSDDTNTDIKNFAQEKKVILVELINDPYMKEKLNKNELSAEELLANPEFVEMFLSSKSQKLIDGPDSEDKRDYLYIENLSIIVGNAAESQSAVISASQASRDAEDVKDQAMKAYIDSAEDLKVADRESNNVDRELRDIMSHPSVDNYWNNSGGHQSDLDITTMKNGDSISLSGWTNADGGGGDNVTFQKDGNDIVITFANGEQYRVNSIWAEAQKKEIEFIKTMSATPVMRRLIGMGNTGFDEFSRILQSKNPQATMENPRVFMNMAMDIVGKLVWAKDMPQNFAEGKLVDEWIRGYMNPDRITNWRKVLKEKWLMKEDNSLNSYIFNEAVKNI